MLDKINAFNGQTPTVKIKLGSRDGRSLSGERKWAAGQWNTLTLPFDITVAELSQKLGYAIVNVVDATGYSEATGKPVYKFKLTMKGGYDNDNLIPANKPFTIKTTDDLADIDADEDGFISFGSKTIVAPTEEDFAGVAAGGNSVFKPTYVTKTVTKDDEGKIWFLMGNYVEWAFITTDATWDIAPFEGYIDQSNNTTANVREATFIMEEIDGTTTVIKGVDADNLNKKQNVEGLYNLNGMKMDGAPLQKGIYIQNGKKIVIK